ncbi:hypothetical protein MYX77_05655 [Acidobacteriia bacterium AH_259_A11_L15]|nr:hypothetical protein [Acidobacteriia bacterium AH_259_A11_L15]
MAEEKGKQPLPWGQRLRRAALFVLFFLVLLIPKALGLRGRRRLWMTLRFLAAVVGAGLVLASGGEWGWLSAVGIALLLVALAARPARETKTTDEQARELGALVVLNGGRFQAGEGNSMQTRLYVAEDRVHVLDLEHRRLLEIPLGGVSSVVAEEAQEVQEAEEAKGQWRLVVEWSGGRAVFWYGGYFAEHLARVAETTIKSQRSVELPVVR